MAPLDVEMVGLTAPRAAQAVRMQSADQVGIAGILVHQVDVGEDHRVPRRSIPPGGSPLMKVGQAGKVKGRSTHFP